MSSHKVQHSLKAHQTNPGTINQHLKTTFTVSHVQRVELLILYLTVVDAVLLKINHKHLKDKDVDVNLLEVKDRSM